MSSFFLSQVLAGMGFACGLISYQFQQRRSVLLCLTCLAVFNSGHFFLLDRPVPAILMLLTGTRYITAIYSRDKRWMYLFSLVAVGTVTLSYSSGLSLLALCGVLLGTFGSFQTSDRIMRLSFIGGNSVWLLHNLLARSPVATIAEVSFLTSNLLGYWRFHGPVAQQAAGGAPPAPPVSDALAADAPIDETPLTSSTETG